MRPAQPLSGALPCATSLDEFWRSLDCDALYSALLLEDTVFADDSEQASPRSAASDSASLTCLHSPGVQESGPAQQQQPHWASAPPLAAAARPYRPEMEQGEHRVCLRPPQQLQPELSPFAAARLQCVTPQPQPQPQRLRLPLACASATSAASNTRSAAADSDALSWLAGWGRLAEEQGVAEPPPFGGSWTTPSSPRLLHVLTTPKRTAPSRILARGGSSARGSPALGPGTPLSLAGSLGSLALSSSAHRSGSLGLAAAASPWDRQRYSSAAAAPAPAAAPAASRKRRMDAGDAAALAAGFSATRPRYSASLDVLTMGACW